MKKRFYLFFTFLIFSNNLHAQKEIIIKSDSVKQFVDKTLSILQENSLNKNKIDWNALQSDIYGKIQNAESVEEILPIYSYIFEKIGDHHGWLSYKNKNYRWNRNTEQKSNKAIKNAVNNYKTVYATMLTKEIAYLRIPGNSDFNAKKMDSISNNIIDEIDKINSKKIKGWVIDLRLNTGGNMYPMISGISDLIGTQGKLGGFVSSQYQSEGEWFLRDGNLYVDTNKVLEKKKIKKPIKKILPLAVLISGYTASSGEMTAITLIGRKNTKLFGEESAGYTTTNQGFKIDENAGLNVAVGYVIDRTEKIYVENIKPDLEIIGGDNFEDLASDKKIIESLKWLKKRSNRR